MKKGVNDDEIADIVRFALKWSCVRGVTFQPIQDAGRNEGFDARTDRIVLTEVRRRIAEAGVFALEDLIPLPCNPTQICIGYGLRNGDQVAPITSLIPRELLVAAAPNTVTFEAYPELQRRAFDLLSLSTAQADTSDKLAGLLCCLPDAAVPQDIGYAQTFRVVISQFLDPLQFRPRDGEAVVRPLRRAGGDLPPSTPSTPSIGRARRETPPWRGGEPDERERIQPGPARPRLGAGGGLGAVAGAHRRLHPDLPGRPRGGRVRPGGPGSLSGLPAVLLLGAVGIGPGVVLFLVGRSLLKKTRRAGPPA